MRPTKTGSPFKTEYMYRRDYSTRPTNSVKRLQCREKRIRLDNNQAQAVFSINTNYTERILFGKERKRLHSMMFDLLKLQSEQSQKLVNSDQIETALVHLKTLRALKLFLESDREGVKTVHKSAKDYVNRMSQIHVSPDPSYSVIVTSIVNDLERRVNVCRATIEKACIELDATIYAGGAVLDTVIAAIKSNPETCLSLPRQRYVLTNILDVLNGLCIPGILHDNQKFTPDHQYWLLTNLELELICVKLEDRFDTIKHHINSIVKLAAIVPDFVDCKTLGEMTRLKEHLYNEYVASALKEGVSQMTYIVNSSLSCCIKILILFTECVVKEAVEMGLLPRPNGSSAK